MAWGGPVAQIDMIRQELVTERKWVTPDAFRRLLAIYQALPGPEAHELCVHLGMVARGRFGGLLAGLGFMLPGFVLMFVLSGLYFSGALRTELFQAVFLGMQPAVIAVIARAALRLGQHVLIHRALLAIGVLALVADLLGLSFYVTLPLAGLAALTHARRDWLALGCVCAGLTFAVVYLGGPRSRGAAIVEIPPHSETARTPLPPLRTGQPLPPPDPALQAPVPSLLFSGLKTGLLTFGGAYTAIPFLRHDAVVRGQWMTEREFLDGVALAGVIPAPLIIFSTFVGYAGGGPWGAIAMTFGVFLPAFSFGLLFFRQLEKLIERPALRHFLEGVSAGAVGIIAATAIRLGLAAIIDLRSLLIFSAVLLALLFWKSKLSVPVLILAAGGAGWLIKFSQ